MSEPYNEPAFPSGKVDVGSSWADYPYLGMTLRDYFAGQALIGVVSDWGEHAFTPDVIAARAYALADAMLKKRMGEEP